MILTPQFKTGTVPGFAGGNNVGLLQTLVTWLTSNPGVSGLDWSLEFDDEARDDDGTTSSYGSTYREVILYNDGLSGNENIFIGMREFYYISSQLYGWNLNGYTSLPSTWNGAAATTHQLSDFSSTTKSWTMLPSLQLFNAEMAYWFYATSEFVFVAVRVGSSYYQCYLGNGARLGSPESYPYPLVIAGSERGDTSYQDGGFGPVRPMNDINECSNFIVDPAGTFKKFSGDLLVIPMQANTNTSPLVTSPNGAAILMPVFYITDTNVTCVQLYNVAAYRNLNTQSEEEVVDSDSNLWRIFAQGKNDYEYDWLAVLEQQNYTTTTTTVTSTSSTTTTTTV